MPLGIAGAIRKGMDGAKAKGYTFEPHYMMLDDETGPLSADMLIALNETPENDPNVVVWDGATMYSSYYHGSFRGIKEQVQNLVRYVENAEKRKPKKIYTWVTNCPRCWKEQGGPTTILFARV